MDAETYLKERVEGQLAWLGARSRANKNAFLRHRLLGILLGALIAILSPYAGREGPLKEWIPPTLQLAGAGVALSAALLALYQHQENWVRYRGLKEALEREKMLYLTGSTSAYASSDAFHAFVQRVEALLSGERALWARQASDKAGEKTSERAGKKSEEGSPSTGH